MCSCPINTARSQGRLFLLSWHYVERSRETIFHWLLTSRTAEVARMVGKSRLLHSSKFSYATDCRVNVNLTSCYYWITSLYDMIQKSLSLETLEVSLELCLVSIFEHLCICMSVERKGLSNPIHQPAFRLTFVITHNLTHRDARTSFPVLPIGQWESWSWKAVLRYYSFIKKQIQRLGYVKFTVEKSHQEATRVNDIIDIGAAVEIAG